jgi:hypothetical protein
MISQFNKMISGASLAMLTLLVSAAEIEGVDFPDRVIMYEQPLVLNGVGVRTYFGFTIYAAALYQPIKTTDENQILALDSVSVLKMLYLVDIDQTDVRHAWLKSIGESCNLPCVKYNKEIEKFLSQISQIKNKSAETYIFTKNKLEIQTQTHQTIIDDTDFSKLILATFIGKYPPTDTLKRGLLGQ